MAQGEKGLIMATIVEHPLVKLLVAPVVVALVIATALWAFAIPTDVKVLATNMAHATENQLKQDARIKILEEKAVTREILELHLKNITMQMTGLQTALVEVNVNVMKAHTLLEQHMMVQPAAPAGGK